MIKSIKLSLKIYLLSLIIISIAISDQPKPTQQNTDLKQVPPAQPTSIHQQPSTTIPSSQTQQQTAPNPEHSSPSNTQPSSNQPQNKQQQPKNNQQQLSTQYAQDSKISRYQQARNRQKNQVKNTFAQQQYTFAHKNVLFQVDLQTEQFILSPTSNQEVIINMVIYTLYDNAYGIIRDIEIELPTQVYVYQDNNKVLAFGEFYFQKALKFPVKQSSYYSIRFRNSGQPKLVSFTYPSMIQSSHVSNLYKKESGEYHLYKINALVLKIEEITQKLKRHSFWDDINNQLIIGYLKKYFNYQFMEMFIVLGIAVYQIHIVKKLFKIDSIQ